MKTMSIQLPILRDQDLRVSSVLPDGASGASEKSANTVQPLKAVKTLKVGELARQSGKTVRALHLYEERGLLDPIERSKGGFRLYAQDSLVRVRWISKLQEMGFSLTDIQNMLRQWEHSGSAPDAMLRVGQLLKVKLDETREQMARLRALEDELESSLEYLETCPTCSPKQGLTACTACELHAQDQSAPDLVAGFHAH
jgi:MerR family copper efflux transcriptional regulator